MKLLSTTYAKIAGSSANFPDGVRRAKQQLIGNNFAVEADNLLRLLVDIEMMEEDGPSKKALRATLEAILVAFPVYRTYGTRTGVDRESRALWRKVSGDVDRLPQPHDKRALAFIDRVFRGDVKATAREKASEFRCRVQQLTGPLTAKAVEDTMFYRFNRLLALNEVGGEAEGADLGLEHFHRLMSERAETQPHGLSATSTHDTKRGEDARARLYAISEAPGVWAQAVQRWRDMNKPIVKSLADGLAPDAETEWMLYQALAGVWPSDIGDELPKDLEDRFIAYLEKALREAKQRTNWTAVNAPYEEAVKGYAQSLLSPQNSAFLTDFRQTLRPFIRAGLFNGVTQGLIKLVAPGVPDIYQGAEGLDFSLVDPDNRREPDFGQLLQWLSTDKNSMDEAALLSGALKQHILTRGLHFRCENTALLRDGGYEPLRLRGEKSAHAVSFLRSSGDQFAIVVAPRMLFELHEKEWPMGTFWGNTSIVLPSSHRNRQLKNALTGERIAVEEELLLAEILDRLPAALLGTE